MALVSVTEGEDKPLKYLQLFNSADVVVVTKTDIADAVEWDRDAALSAIQTHRAGGHRPRDIRTHRGRRARFAGSSRSTRRLRDLTIRPTAGGDMTSVLWFQGVRAAATPCRSSTPPNRRWST